MAIPNSSLYLKQSYQNEIKSYLIENKEPRNFLNYLNVNFLDDIAVNKINAFLDNIRVERICNLNEQSRTWKLDDAECKKIKILEIANRVLIIANGILGIIGLIFKNNRVILGFLVTLPLIAKFEDWLRSINSKQKRSANNNQKILIEQKKITNERIDLLSYKIKSIDKSSLSLPLIPSIKDTTSEQSVDKDHHQGSDTIEMCQNLMKMRPSLELSPRSKKMLSSTVDLNKARLIGAKILLISALPYVNFKKLNQLELNSLLPPSTPSIDDRINAQKVDKDHNTESDSDEPQLSLFQKNTARNLNAKLKQLARPNIDLFKARQLGTTVLLFSALSKFAMEKVAEMKTLESQLQFMERVLEESVNQQIAEGESTRQLTNYNSSGDAIVHRTQLKQKEWMLAGAFSVMMIYVISSKILGELAKIRPLLYPT